MPSHLNVEIPHLSYTIAASLPDYQVYQILIYETIE